MPPPTISVKPGTGWPAFKRRSWLPHQGERAHRLFINVRKGEHSDLPRSSSILSRDRIQEWLTPKDPWAFVLLGLLLASLIWHWFSLLRTPLPYVDEVWFLSKAWALVQTGSPIGPLDHGVFDRFEGAATTGPLLNVWLLSLPMRIAGPTLGAVRAVSLAFGVLLLAAIYVIGRHTGGRRLGLLAALLASTSSAFLYSAHLGRPDAGETALAYIGIALILTDRSPGLSARSVLSGLIAAAAFEMHPTGIIFLPVMGGLYFAIYGWSVIRQGRFWGFSLGAGVGLAAYVAIHILPYPQTYFGAGALINPWRTPPILTLSPQVWLESLQETTVFFLLGPDLHLQSLLRSSLIVVPLLALSRRHSPTDKMLLSLYGLLFLAFLTLVRYKPGYYDIMVAPAVALLLAALLMMWAGDLQNRLVAARLGLPRAHLVLAGLTVGILLASVLRQVSDTLSSDPMPELARTLQRVRAAIAPGTLTMGPQLYWLGLRDERFLGWEQLVFFQKYAPGTSLEGAFAEFRPDYFLVDRDIQMFTAARPEDLAYVGYQYFWLPRQDLQGILARRGHLVDTVSSRIFGIILIYHLDWSEP